MAYYNGYNMPLNYTGQPYYNGGALPEQIGQLRGQQYPPAMQSPQLQQQFPLQAQNAGNGVIWVQGEEGAKAYMVAPGNTVQLWDSENPVIYLKSADMSGVPSMRIFDLVERTAAPRMPLDAPKSVHEEYVTRAEFDALADKLNTLMNKEQTKPAKSAGKTKEETDNG